MSRLTIVIISLSIIGVLSYLLQQETSFSSSDEIGPIVIGFIGPLTGDAANIGEPISKAISLAVDEINAEGGIQGRLVEVVYKDGKCDRNAALNAAKDLIYKEDVDIIVGGVCSDEALAILEVSDQEKVLVLSPSATSPNLTGVSNYFFRNVPSDSISGEVLAKVVNKKHDNIAVIAEQTEYAQPYADIVTERLKIYNKRVVIRENYTSGTSNFEAILERVEEAQPEAIVILPQTGVAAGMIVKQLREKGNEKPIYGSSAFAEVKALGISGTSSEGITIVDALIVHQNNRKAIKFIQNYTERYGSLDIEYYPAAAYDDIYILVEAITETTSTDPGKIRKYILSKSFDGALGTYKFNKEGDVEGIDVTVQTIEQKEKEK